MDIIKKIYACVHKLIFFTFFLSTGINFPSPPPNLIFFQDPKRIIKEGKKIVYCLYFLIYPHPSPFFIYLNLIWNYFFLLIRILKFWSIWRLLEKKKIIKIKFTIFTQIIWRIKNFFKCHSLRKTLVKRSKSGKSEK